MDDYNIHFKDIDLGMENINKDLQTAETRFEAIDTSLHSLENDILGIK